MSLRARIPGVLHRIEKAFPPGAKAWLKQCAPGLTQQVHDAALAFSPTDSAESVIADGPLVGRRFTCRVRFEADYIFGTHEPNVTRWMLTQIRAGDTVLDVGAHAGYASLIAAAQVGPSGRVIAFEPNPSNVEMLHRNLNANMDLAPRVSLEQMAVSGTTGTARFGGHETTGALARDGYEVRTTTIDDFALARQIRPAVIKMDIEGGETLALDGMSTIASTCRPALIIEIHDSAAYARLDQFMQDHGYRATDERGAVWERLPGWSHRSIYLATPVQSGASLRHRAEPSEHGGAQS
jgi:FkbM family methyltransferase